MNKDTIDNTDIQNANVKNAETEETEENVETVETTENVVENNVETVVENNIEQIEKKTNNGLKIFATVVACIILVAVGFCVAKYLDNKPSIPNDKLMSELPGTLIKVKLNGDYLEVTPISAVARLNKISTQFQIDKSDVDVFDSFEFVNNSALISGFNTDMDRQYIEYIGSNRQQFGDITVEDIDRLINNKSKNIEKIEKSNTYEPDPEKTADNAEGNNAEGNNAEGNLSEQYSVESLYGEGYRIHYSLMYENDRENAEKDSVNYINFSKNHNHSFILDIDGIGEVELNNLSILHNKIGVAYNNMYNMLNIINTETGSVALFITSMNNRALANTVYTLDRYNDYNNVYIDEYFDDDSNYGFRSFTIMTNSGMYYFKLGEDIENPRDIIDEILSLMGIKPEDEYIDTGAEDYISMDAEELKKITEENMANTEGNTENNTENNTEDNTEGNTEGNTENNTKRVIQRRVN